MADDARLHDWFDAERRIKAHPPQRRLILDTLCDEIVAELARRLGRPFVFNELVALYEQGTDWAVAMLTEGAPGEAWAWAPNLAVDAAFARYARFARDIGGGRRIGTKRFSEDDFGSKIIGS